MCGKLNRMIEIGYKEFNDRFEQYFNKVANNEDAVIIKNDSGERILMISLEEFNAMKETLHLLSSKANADRLYESIQQMKNGEVVENGLTPEE